jgi:hypothetical protein
VETRVIVPQVSADLRQPVPISDRRAETLRDLSLLATEHLVSAQAANDKITTIDTILRCAEARAAGQDIPEECEQWQK